MNVYLKRKVDNKGKQSSIEIHSSYIVLSVIHKKFIKRIRDLSPFLSLPDILSCVHFSIQYSYMHRFCMKSPINTNDTTRDYKWQRSQIYTRVKMLFDQDIKNKVHVQIEHVKPKASVRFSYWNTMILLEVNTQVLISYFQNP